MRRAAALVLLALAAAGCGPAVETESVPPPTVAEPRAVELDWREHYGEGNARLVFRVEGLEITEDGWRASIGFTNETETTWELGRRRLELAFGLLLLPTGDLADLQRLSARGELPAIREAVTIEPELPLVLRPRQAWDGTIAAPGSLPAGSWVRVSFGTFVAIGDPPEGMQPVVVWLTDRATQL